MPGLPLLYSFRRCPYAIRSRLAIRVSEVELNYYEVDLKNKPQGMLDISPKATVPVLQLSDGTVIDESLDIMSWALQQNDPGNWLESGLDEKEKTKQLIDLNDNNFKLHLDHYKYADRFPEHPVEYYRQQAEEFLQKLEDNLTDANYLISDHITFADIAIFPFIRQFAFVDKDWFDQSKYINCQSWLKTLLDTQLFIDVMKKTV